MEFRRLVAYSNAADRKLDPCLVLRRTSTGEEHGRINDNLGLITMTGSTSGSYAVSGRSAHYCEVGRLNQYNASQPRLVYKTGRETLPNEPGGRCKATSEQGDFLVRYDEKMHSPIARLAVALLYREKPHLHYYIGWSNKEACRHCRASRRSIKAPWRYAKQSLVLRRR